MIHLAELSLIADAGYDTTNLASGDFQRDSGPTSELLRLRMANALHGSLVVDEVLQRFVREA